MEREFQSMYVAGDGSAGEYSLAPFKPEDSYYSAFSNLTFQSSVASLNQEKALLSSLDYPYSSSSSLPGTLTYGDFQANDVHANDQVVNTDQKLESIDFMAAEPPLPKLKLKTPKHEHSPPEPYNFIVPISSIPATEYALFPDSCAFIHQLPDFRSLEYVQNYDLAVNEPSSSRKRGKSPPSPSAAALTTDPYVLQAIFRNFEYASYAATAPENPQSARNYHRANDVARIRRNALSEKTRCLRNLLPWDRKMDTATMYEEAHKYIKFLQAQISVLQSMPRDTGSGSGFSTRSNPSVDNTDFYGGLGRLNRQQLLQVLLNSQAAQTVLCSKGFCVYSWEQLLVLKKIAAAKVLSNPSMLH